MTFRPRLIPVLLLQGKSLVKTRKFKSPKYIGDPINAVHLFNEFKSDELVFLDTDATIEKRKPNLDLIKDVGDEANMPFAVGGGIRDLKTIEAILNRGAEKVIIGSYALWNPGFIKDASEYFGSSSISVCIDVKTQYLSKRSFVWANRGKKKFNFSPQNFAQMMEEMGSGEIILQSIERDGAMDGYDIDLIQSVSKLTSVPLVALGGAGLISHFKEAYQAGASAVAGGSFFVFQNRVNKGVLINYPENSNELFD